MASDPILSLNLTIITLRFCKYFLPVIETYTDSTQAYTVHTFKEVTGTGLLHVSESDSDVYALSSLFRIRTRRQQLACGQHGPTNGSLPLPLS